MTMSSQTTAPLFSVIVPVYNKKQYLGSLSASLLKQSFRDFEVIFVDDGSTDGSAEVLDTWVETRFRVITQANAGVSAARNTGVRAARGTYIAFLDADDWYEPEFLAEIHALANRFPEAALYGTAFQMVRGDRRDGSAVPAQAAYHAQTLISDFYAAWSAGAFICASSVAVRASELKRFGLRFREGESHGEDQEMWFALAERAPVAYSRRHLSNYLQQAANSLSFSNRYVDELPFVTRLADRIAQGQTGLANPASASLVIERNRLESAANCGRYGEKRRALQLLRTHLLSPNFIQLKLLVIAAIVMPTPIIRTLTAVRKKFRQA